MKFPFIRRSRLEAARAKTRSDAAQFAMLHQQLAVAQAQAQELTRICEIRRAEIEQLQEVEKLCDHRAREIATMRSEMALADFAHLRLLDELKAARQALLPGGIAPVSSRQPLPLVFAVDLEPDKREVDRQNPSWHGSAEFFRRLPELRQRISVLAGNGGPFVLTWLTRADPQIEICNGHAAYAFRRFAGEFCTAIAAGDEIGLHVHPWRWNESKERWMQEHGNDAWIDHCIQVACETYREHFGKAPVSYSSGDRFLSNAVVRKLNEMGVKLDLTLELLPGAERLVIHELDSGSIPDTSRVPNRVYRPSVEDYRQPDPARRDGVILMPQTASAGGHLCAWAPPAIFERALELALMNPAELTHLAFVVRTDIALAPSWDHFVTNTETLARYAKEGTVQFTTGERGWECARQWLDKGADQIDQPASGDDRGDK